MATYNLPLPRECWPTAQGAADSQPTLTKTSVYSDLQFK